MARATDASVGEENVTRRRLLSFVGWSSFVTFFGGITLASLKPAARPVGDRRPCAQPSGSLGGVSTVSMRSCARLSAVLTTSGSAAAVSS